MEFRVSSLVFGLFNMKYYLTKSTNYSFEEAVGITTNTLKEGGFG